MATSLSGTPQSGRKRPAAAAANTAFTAATVASGTTPGRGINGNGSRAAASMASPRGSGSSLLTPEPAHKRRGVSRGGATGRSVGPEGGGGGGGGNSATPNSVFTPGTGTAHLLLQLRRDWAQQQHQGPPQQQQQQQFSQSGGGGSGAAPPPPPPPLQSDGAVGRAPAGEENLSEDAAALIRSCSYAVPPGSGSGSGSGSSSSSQSNICDQRERPAAPKPGAAAVVGSKGGAAGAPRGASGGRRDDRRAAAPASCGSRRGRGGGGNGAGGNGAGGNGAQKPALAAATAFGTDRPRNEAVGFAAGVGDFGLAVAESGMQLSSAPVPAAIISLDGCSCKKSMCLKLYCQCFAAQHVCSGACKCENCLNSEAHGAERRAAVRELLGRSPHAFDAKFKTEVLVADGGNGTARAAVVHNTGCGCSKSACLKRYCECFNGGIACSDKCRCKDCRNTAKAVGARVRAKNMAAKSSMLNAGAAAVAAAASAGRGGGGGGGGGAVITGGGGGGRGGGSSGGGTFSGEVAAAATAAAVAAAAQRGNMAEQTMRRSEEEGAGDRRQDEGHGKGNIDIDGGGGGHGPAVGRSPLGVLPGGRADGENDSGANRGTIRV
eukprot:g9337.t1